MIEKSITRRTRAIFYLDINVRKIIRFTLGWFSQKMGHFLKLRWPSNRIFASFNFFFVVHFVIAGTRLSVLHLKKEVL